MTRWISLGAFLFVVVVCLAVCSKVDGQAQNAPETDRIEISVKPFIARQADTGNLIVDLRPGHPIPEGYELAGSTPIVEVDAAASTIMISGLFTLEPSTNPTLKLRQADLVQAFEFEPPEPKVYKIVYVPERARGPMTRREINFGSAKPPAKREFLLIAPTATVTRDPETEKMTVALSQSKCVGGLVVPLDENLMVGVNHIERKILVFGAFRYKAPTAVPKHCRVNPENPKRVFEFESTDAGEYEILYEYGPPGRHWGLGKPGLWPSLVRGGQLRDVDLSRVSSE